MTAEIPSGIGADGDLEIQVSNTADVITIFIDLGNQNTVERIGLSRWLDGNHATRIRCIVLGPEVEQLQGIVHSQKTNGWPADTAIPVRWDVRELDIGRPNQSMLSDSWNDAVRRLFVFENPLHQGSQERPHRPDLWVWIWLLLAVAEWFCRRQWQSCGSMLGPGHNKRPHIGRFGDIPFAERVG